MIQKYSFMGIKVDPEIEKIDNLDYDPKNAAPGSGVKKAVDALKSRTEPEKITSVDALNLEKKR